MMWDTPKICTQVREKRRVMFIWKYLDGVVMKSLDSGPVWRQNLSTRILNSPATLSITASFQVILYEVQDPSSDEFTNGSQRITALRFSPAVPIEAVFASPFTTASAFDEFLEDRSNDAGRARETSMGAGNNSRWDVNEVTKRCVPSLFGPSDEFVMEGVLSIELFIPFDEGEVAVGVDKSALFEAGNNSLLPRCLDSSIEEPSAKVRTESKDEPSILWMRPS